MERKRKMKLELDPHPIKVPARRLEQADEPTAFRDEVLAGLRRLSDRDEIENLFDEHLDRGPPPS